MTSTEYLFWQTADPTVYRPMVELTGPHNRSYCESKGLGYECFVGISRGYWPWQATFNRIVKLKELLDAGFAGWFIYVDADSYVFDLSFDVKDYLKAHERYFFIAATGGDSRRLAVNAGVFFMNLSNEWSWWVIRRWYEVFTAVATDDYLREHGTWGNDGINDQDMLHKVFAQRQAQISSEVHVDNGALINYNGSFIRQVLRSKHKEFDRRMDAIARDIAVSRNNFLNKTG